MISEENWKENVIHILFCISKRKLCIRSFYGAHIHYFRWFKHSEARSLLARFYSTRAVLYLVQLVHTKHENNSNISFLFQSDLCSALQIKSNIIPFWRFQYDDPVRMYNIFFTNVHMALPTALGFYIAPSRTIFRECARIILSYKFYGPKTFLKAITVFKEPLIH